MRWEENESAKRKKRPMWTSKWDLNLDRVSEAAKGKTVRAPHLSHSTPCAQRYDKMMQTVAFLTDKKIARVPFAAGSYPGSAPGERVEGAVRIQL